MKKFIGFAKNVLPGLLLLVALVAGTYGSQIPKDYDYYKKSGWFLVRPYKYGVYITQPNTGLFYNFSPYDAYYQNVDGSKNKMIEFVKDLKSDESNVIKDTTFKPKILGISTLSYLNKIEPTATFFENNKKLVFGSKVSGNSINFFVQKDELNTDPNRKTVLAISFNDDDFIVDQNSILLLKKTPDDISDVNKIFYDTPISTPSSTESIVTDGVSKLFVFNKIMNGVLGINLEKQNAKIIALDQDYKTMYLESADAKKPTILVETFDSLKEALQDL